MNELNNRQLDLYNLLKNNPDKAFFEIEICCSMPNWYICTNTTPATFHDSPARQLITADIRTINECDTIQKIIISTPDGVKLASKEEAERYIKGQYAAIFRKLKRIRKLERKAGLDGQYRLTIGKERNVIEAFTESINRLKAARLAKNLKLADVAAALNASGLNIDVPLLSKFENGVCCPNKQTLLKLAEIYGTEPFYLTGECLPEIYE